MMILGHRPSPFVGLASLRFRLSWSNLGGQGGWAGSAVELVITIPERTPLGEVGLVDGADHQVCAVHRMSSLDAARMR